MANRKESILRNRKESLCNRKEYTEEQEGEFMANRKESILRNRKKCLWGNMNVYGGTENKTC